jgi:hypothetical protein
MRSYVFPIQSLSEHVKLQPHWNMWLHILVTSAFPVHFKVKIIMTSANTQQKISRTHAIVS